MKTTIWLRTVPIIFMFFIIPLGMQSQQSDFSCYVYDENTRKQLPYANIMFLNKSYGVTSDTSGLFVIPSKYANLNDTLSISYMGYKTRTVILKQVNTSSIFLSPQPLMLDEVIVKPEKDRMIKPSTTILNKFRRKDCFLLFSPCDSNEMDLWIPIRPHEPTIEAIFFPGISSDNLNKQSIDKIRLYIANYKIPSKFRIRIFNANPNLSPGIDLIKEQIIITSTKVNDLIEVDMRNYNITFPENGFFIGLELLLLPENASSVVVSDSVIFLYSPFLNYIISDDTISNWIYSGGKWKLNNDLNTTRFVGKGKKHHYKPAISVILKKQGTGTR